mgnify:CR=1 FL=1
MMTKPNKFVQWMLAVAVGVFLAAFSYGACTAQAAETTVEAQEQAPADSNAENGGGAMILLMGGMLIIIGALCCRYICIIGGDCGRAVDS